MGDQDEEEVEKLTALRSSSTSRRVIALKSVRERLKNQTFGRSSRMLLGVLFITYPLYVDRSSRREVLACLQALLECDTSIFPDFAHRIAIESSKAALAPTSALVLIEWIALAFRTSASAPHSWTDSLEPLVLADAVLLDLVCAANTRRSVFIAARSTIRKALRAILGAPSGARIALSSIVERLTKPGVLGFRTAPFLGLLAEASLDRESGCGSKADLEGKQNESLFNYKGQYLSFWTREVIASRSAVPAHVASAFIDFFHRFVTLEEVETELAPALEKAILRAPEVALNGLVAPMFVPLPASFDLSRSLRDHLMKPLLTNAKSTNDSLRAGALSAFQIILAKCHDDQFLAGILDETQAPLISGKLTSADQKVSYCTVLENIKPSEGRSLAICHGLAPLVLKEPSEAALAAEAQAFSTHVLHLLRASHGETDTLAKVFLRGLSDRKPGVQKIWALRLGALLWEARDTIRSKDPMRAFEPSLSKLLNIFDDVTANPIQAANSGLLVAAYIALSLAQAPPVLDAAPAHALVVKSSKIIDKALPPKGKTSFLLNPKCYTKLVTEEDHMWLIRALRECCERVISLDLEAETACAWSQALLYVGLSRVVPPATRQHMLQAISKLYERSPVSVSRLVLRGLWTWFRDVATPIKDSAAAASQSGMQHMIRIIRAISPVDTPAQLSRPSGSHEAISRQLIEMLVLCQPIIVPRANWIKLCIRMGQDPGHLVSTHAYECVLRVNRALDEDRDALVPLGDVKRAAFRSMAELAFVASNEILPLVVGQIQQDLAVSQISDFSRTDYAVARAPAGICFVDVLASKQSNNATHKGSSEYDLMRWEAELRSQVAAKKGATKKLSTDDQARVDAQLAKEEGIRGKVLGVKDRLLRGIGLINGLATGPPTDAAAWLGSSIQNLTGLIAAGVGQLVDDSADQTYITCSSLVAPRLGQLRASIGVATLRALQSSHVPEALCQEPLGLLVTRVLYRLRLASEQRPFDNVSLLYVLPLLTIVLDQVGIGASDDFADEQVTLALEFISIHAGNFSNSQLPRAQILGILISSMQKFAQHYRLIKDCLADVCRAISDSASEEETQMLLKGVIAPQAPVRTAVLQAVREFLDLTTFDFVKEIWIACHDDEGENAAIADAIWQENALEESPENAVQLLPYLERPDPALRGATARSLAACVADDAKVFAGILSTLQRRYCELAKPRVPERDAYGLIKKTDLTDPWERRHGIAMAFKELAPAWTQSELVPFIDFLIISGAVGDHNNAVREAMIEGASSVIAEHGKSKIEELMAIFETTIASSAKDESSSDLISEAVIILYGALAQHLKRGDDRIAKVMDRLLEALTAPSEGVQFAVSRCLAPLIRNAPEESSDGVQRTLGQALAARQYATRRGSAYGLAGIVSGLGLSALREHRIMATLKSGVENKKDANARQGALFAYELFSLILGDIFEPYVIEIVPQLIATFGDPSADVREACLDAAKTCFSRLSSYGVKVILPILLEGLDALQWRSKKGACDLLGAMAFLDPRQLAQSLPDIIPPLTGVLNDSHKEVRASANRSLQRFGEVISNPEVKSLVNVLLKALSDPTKHTEDALDSLIRVSFVHYLDAPSLALVVRILQRGLGDRSSTKRKAAQIIGSLAHLTERKDVVSHLPILVEGLRAAVVDPVPATRATSSKALGSLVEKLGEDALPDLIPSLMGTLRADAGAGDRLGSAQALSEVLAGLGTSRLEEILPAILQNATSSRPSVREGFMSLFIFLPACFGNSFANYLSRIIPPILAGLADELESIRDTALRAGRLLVKNFATKSIDLLLPELDRGLADENYRIRLSSVELVGDLLFSLTGVSLQEDGEDDADRVQESGQSLLEALGEDKRNRVLSSLYICRCDTSGLVRSAAINVWKALVASPRTLKELIPTLSQILIKRLASSNPEQKVIAGNALGELIRKAGEGILATLLPTLEEELDKATDSDSKQGICIALREIISAASPDTLEDYEDSLIAIVRTALVDSDDEVRNTAAEAFDSLQRVLGKKAVDRVLPHLLNLLRNDVEADQALSALLTLLTDNVRANVILPNLIPTLLTSPMTAFNARAVASLAKVAGPSLSRRLPTILNALMDSMVGCKSPELLSDLEDSFDTVLISADQHDGLNTIMSVMLAMVKHEDHRRRTESAKRLGMFFGASEVDFSRYYPDLIRTLLLSFDDRDKDVVRATCAALTDLMKCFRREDMDPLVIPTRQVLQQVGVAGGDLPGFCLPKGINSVLPIFLQGLMNGTAEQRTQAALAISDVVDRTSADALKPFVTNITGPLIRVVSEKSVDLKCAILLTLNNLLDKIPLFLKPFLPQLQRTFAKALADTSSDLLRARAAKALGTLLNLNPRIDPLIAELVTGTKTPDTGVRNAMLKALYEVVSKAGGNMNDTSRNAILALIDGEPSEDDEAMAITNARLLGALTKNLPVAATNALIKHRVLPSRLTLPSVLSLNSIFVESPGALLEAFGDDVTGTISRGIVLKQTNLAENFVLAGGKYLLCDDQRITEDTYAPILEALASVIGPGNSADARRLALVVVRTVSRVKLEAARPHLGLLVPPVFASVRDTVIPIKLAAEAAFVGLFDVIDSDNAQFEQYMAGPGAALSPTLRKSMQDYFKRVALRLAAQAKERRDAEGGQGGLGLSNDEKEDEREIWSVGKMEIGNVFSQDT